VVWEYSKKWRFVFNYDKSAVVVFERKSKDRIVYGDCKEVCKCGRHWRLGSGFIVEVEAYKYLGIDFDRNCTFSIFKSRIADKARRNRVILGSIGANKGSLSIKANINLWEGIIRAGLEYGAEVWGAGNWEEGELIQREVGRRVLKCSSKTTSVAVRGELGWWKLSTRRNFLMLKFWIRVLLMEDSRLVKRIYNISRIEYIFRNRTNWVKNLHRLVQKYNLVDLWVQESRVWLIDQEDLSVEGVKKFWFRTIYKKVHAVEQEEWRLEIEKKPKLRTYKSVKTSLALESYLLSEKERRGGYILITLRTGTNKLRIETGRWKRPVEPVDERKCLVCVHEDIEDEKHFMLFCRGYAHFRASLFQQIFQVSEGK